MKFPFIFVGKPFPTLCEQRIHAWKKEAGDGLPDPPKQTYAGRLHKQFLTVQRFKRKAS